MSRAIWSGSISFGLVNVPVRLYTATVSHTVAFHQFQKDTGERIRYKRIAEESGEEVPYEDIVKGYEIKKGKYVMVEPEELESVEPTKTRTIEIEEFVDLDEIDPIAWESTYYLGPAEKVGAEKPYVLLRRAMEDTNKVAVGRFVMRTKEYLTTIRPLGDLLALETMFFADEIRDADTVENLPGKVSVSQKELAMAEQLIEAMTTKWKHEKHEDTFHDRVMAMIKRKAKGEEIVIERPPREAGRVVDLMKALKASVAASQKRKPAAAEEPAPARAKAVGRANGKRGAAYDALTKTELLERAAEAAISGRSKMSKEELIDALRKAA